MYSPVRALTGRVGTILLLVWAAMSLAAILFVATMGTNCPYGDEWEFVPALVGEEPVIPWLWKLHNEHRLPLPRLIYYGLYQVTGDYRAGMLLQVAMLAALSLACMKLSARMRGRPHWADLFFPVSLLHAGHWENLLMGYQICFTLTAVLVTLVGIVNLRTHPANIFRSGLAAAILSIALMLCGSSGLIVALCVSAWVAWIGLVQLRASRISSGVLLMVLSMIPAAYLAMYLNDYHRPAHHPLPVENSHPILGVAMVAGETLAMSFGYGCANVWWLVLAGILIVEMLTARDLFTSHSLDPPRSIGLFAILSGIVAIALAIGFGRAGFGNQMGLWARYSLLTWPLLGLTFLYWIERDGKIGRWMQLSICSIAAVLFPTNTVTGLINGSSARTSLMQIEYESRKGVEPSAIIQLFPNTAQQGQEARAIRAIPLLWPKTK